MDESCGKGNLQAVRKIAFWFKVWTAISLAASIVGIGITSSTEFRADPLEWIALYRPLFFGIFLTGGICFFGLLITTVKVTRMLYAERWIPYKPEFFWITQFVLSFCFNGFGMIFVPLYLIVKLEEVTAKLSSRQT